VHALTLLESVPKLSRETPTPDEIARLPESSACHRDRYPLLDSADCPPRRIHPLGQTPLNSTPANLQTETPAVQSTVPATRLRSLQALGIFCGFAAGAWLGGAEAPIKLVNPQISPITVSLIMVCGVFLARWSVPAFIRGTSHLSTDVRQAP